MTPDIEPVDVSDLLRKSRARVSLAQSQVTQGLLLDIARHLGAADIAALGDVRAAVNEVARRSMDTTLPEPIRQEARALVRRCRPADRRAAVIATLEMMHG